MESRSIQRAFASPLIGHKPELSVKPGDLLRATIVGVNNNTVELTIGREKIIAEVPNHTRRMLSAIQSNFPQRVSLRVIQSQPQILLKIESLENRPPASNLATIGRELLPNQQPLRTILNKLNMLSSSVAHRSPGGTIDPNHAQTLQSLWRGLPEMRQLSTPHSVQNALQNSGLFYEKNVAAALQTMTNSAVPTDLKFQLLSIRHTLNQQLGKTATKKTDTKFHASTGPANLLKLIEAGLARIEMLQLASQIDAETSKHSIFFEVPFTDKGQVETIEGRVEQQRHRTGNEPRQNSVSFQLSIPLSDTESVLVRLMKTADRMSITLWSQSPRVLALVEASYKSFEAHLNAQQDNHFDITIKAFEPHPNDGSKIFSNLISEKI